MHAALLLAGGPDQSCNTTGRHEEAWVAPMALLAMAATPGAASAPASEAAWQVSRTRSRRRKRARPTAPASCAAVSSSRSWNLRKPLPPCPVRYTCRGGGALTRRLGGAACVVQCLQKQARLLALGPGVLHAEAGRSSGHLVI